MVDMRSIWIGYGSGGIQVDKEIRGMDEVVREEKMGIWIDYQDI